MEESTPIDSLLVAENELAFLCCVNCDRNGAVPVATQFPQRQVGICPVSANMSQECGSWHSPLKQGRCCALGALAREPAGLGCRNFLCKGL